MAGYLRSRRITTAAYFWPGLPQLWTRGSWAGLAVAVGFTAIGNVLLLATFVFDEWIADKDRLMGYGVLATTWLLAWWQARSARSWHKASFTTYMGQDATMERTEEQRDRLFCEAQRCYLQSDWVTTEKLLLQLLKQDARDVESRLMLATLWRHQGRPAEARRQLDRLERLEAADKWRHEIAAERAALVKVVRQDDSSPKNEATPTRNVVPLDDSTTYDAESRSAA